MHVPGQRGGAAIAAEFRRGKAIGGEARAGTTCLFWNANGQQALLMHVAKVLEREAGVAVMLGGTGSKHAAAEAAGLVDQSGIAVRQAKRARLENRRVRSDLLEVAVVHGSFPLGRVAFERAAQEIETGGIE